MNDRESMQPGVFQQAGSFLRREIGKFAGFGDRERVTLAWQQRRSHPLPK
jgi:hypothetical protein